MELLKAEHVSKTYINHKALDAVSIDVPEQSIFGLLGPNGAGKTTLIRIINQITAPDEGKVYLNGERLHQKHIATIGYLPEERGLYRKMKVGEQAMYLAQLKNVPKREAYQQLQSWFKKFDIDEWWDKKVEELSKGMQQKIQFITTVLHKPKLLIFDEPFSGFDPINANLLKKEILKLREDGATVIFSTHNMASVEELCDHIALINKSKKILDGPMKEIKREHSSDIYTAHLKNVNGSLQASLENGFKLLEENPKDEFVTVKIQIMDHSSPNRLVQNLSAIGEIHSFNEVIPSMNDIFISNVQQNR